MTTNIINVMFMRRKGKTRPAYQYDYGQILSIQNLVLPTAYEVHFSNNPNGTSVTSIGNEDGVVIPDEFFLSGSDIYFWLFLHTGESDGETRYEGIIPIIKRARPTDIEPTPVQQDVITQTIAALNVVVEESGASATAAEEAQVAAENARDAVLGMSATAVTLSPGSEATAEYSDGLLTLGIPQGEKGDPGEPGEDGYSPTFTVTDITGGHRVAITDASGTQTFDVMDGDVAEAPVQDVQVNGTSVLGAGGVANVSVAGSDTLGVMKVGGYGLYLNSSNKIAIDSAVDSDIKGGTAIKPIPVFRQEKSVFYGLAKAAGSDEKNSTLAVGTYTDAAKSAISQMLNAPVSVSGTTPSITGLAGVRYICGECATLSIVAPESGCIDVVFTSGSTATVLTVTSAKANTTIKWANGFDPTSLEANTTYEVNVLDGEYGVVGSWT